MAFLNYLLAVKATRNLASVRDFLDGLAPDNGRGSQRTCRQIAGSIGLARTRKRQDVRLLYGYALVNFRVRATIAYAR